LRHADPAPVAADRRRGGSAGVGAQVPQARGQRQARAREARRVAAVPPPRLAGLTKLTLETAPSVCHECIWWQTPGRREVGKDRWMEPAEPRFGACEPIYYDG